MKKVEYSKRATNDVYNIGITSTKFGERTAFLIEMQIKKAVLRIAEFPKNSPRVANQADIHVHTLAHHPYRIFYQIIGSTVLILHIRHTSRNEWQKAS